MSYVDGFVIPVPAGNIEKYREISERAKLVWKKHGALDYKECVVDDDRVEGLRSFADVSGAEAGETTIFAFIVYESREERDRINALVMEDPDLDCDPDDMPFQPSRMAFAGFRTIVEF